MMYYHIAHSGHTNGFVHIKYKTKASGNTETPTNNFSFAAMEGTDVLSKKVKA